MNDQTPAPAKSRTTVPESPFSWLRNEVDRLFGEVAHPARSAFSFGAQFAPMPALELAEKDRCYRLTAELPGLGEDDVDVTVADDILTIAGEKREEADREDDGIAISERRYGAFSRQVRLPSDVDVDKIVATFANGVLTVSLPKNEEARPRERKVAIGKA